MEKLDRGREIIEATKKLYDVKNYRDINIKEISAVTSMSRPSIYNYFQSKEEIFLTMLTDEYLTWVEEINDYKNNNTRVTKVGFAGFLAKSLEKRPLMLKLIANNIADFEENSRMEILVNYKKSYVATLEIVEECLKKFFKGMKEKERIAFIYAFFPFLFGLYPYAVATEKQREALNTIEANYNFYSIYELSFNMLSQLLGV